MTFGYSANAYAAVRNGEMHAEVLDDRRDAATIATKAGIHPGDAVRRARR